ncbi:MAG: hypothetical protein J7464_03905, partial [Chloroflexus sp.]|nr:hypothetical protein [Chloroflexus sp.]
MMFIGVNHGQKSEILKTPSTISKLSCCGTWYHHPQVSVKTQRLPMKTSTGFSKDAKVADEDFGHR